MPALPAIALAVTAATAIGTAVEANQTVQHAKGAAEAQTTAMNDQIKTATDADTAAKKTQSQTAQAGAAQKMAVALANMDATGGMGGTNTGASSMPAAETAGKTLLGG